jgi:hypothetical protein
MSEPRLVEFDTLQKLLRTTYNESDNPFIQISDEYSIISLLECYWYIILIIFVPIVLYLVIFFIKSTKNISTRKKESKARYVNDYFDNI